MPTVTEKNAKKELGRLLNLPGDPSWQGLYDMVEKMLRHAREAGAANVEDQRAARGAREEMELLRRNAAHTLQAVEDLLAGFMQVFPSKHVVYGVEISAYQAGTSADRQRRVSLFVESQPRMPFTARGERTYLRAEQSSSLAEAVAKMATRPNPEYSPPLDEED
jgi:DNA-binding transcriptional LysR family regulator